MGNSHATLETSESKDKTVFPYNNKYVDIWKYLSFFSLELKTILILHCF
tara:strand:- start:21960 stop:22106 length:147 start_codon:yes stop_codon:yes gene_type:complete